MPKDMSLINKGKPLTFYCQHCNSEMVFSSRPYGEVEEGPRWYYYECTRCHSTGPQFTDAIDIPTDKCIRLANESMTPIGRLKNLMQCDKCSVDVFGTQIDNGKTCPIPGCGGVVNIILERVYSLNKERKVLC